MLHRPPDAKEVKTVVAMMDDIAWYDPKGQEILHALEGMKAQGATIVMASNEKSWGEAMDYMQALRFNKIDIGKQGDKVSSEDVMTVSRLENASMMYDPQHPTADTYVTAMVNALRTDSDNILLIGKKGAVECQLAERYGHVTVADHEAILNGEINTLPFTNTSKKSGPSYF